MRLRRLGRRWLVSILSHGESLAQRQPAMPTAVQMQQLAEAGARLPAPAMAPPRLALGDQAGGLQGLLHECVAEAHAVLAPGQLVEVADIEPLISLAIEREQALHVGDRARLGEGICRRRSKSPW